MSFTVTEGERHRTPQASGAGETLRPITIHNDHGTVVVPTVSIVIVMVVRMTSTRQQRWRRVGKAEHYREASCDPQFAQFPHRFPPTAIRPARPRAYIAEP